jgi:hypothetical protein
MDLVEVLETVLPQLAVMRLEQQPVLQQRREQQQEEHQQE